jgi:hypothetical protein
VIGKSELTVSMSLCLIPYSKPVYIQIKGIANTCPSGIILHGMLNSLAPVKSILVIILPIPVFIVHREENSRICRTKTHIDVVWMEIFTLRILFIQVKFFLRMDGVNGIITLEVIDDSGDGHVVFSFLFLIDE